jgi:DUF971 family protein
LSSPEANVHPLEIRAVRAERRLEIDFDDGSSWSYPAELLRVESPSAEVQGHTPSQKVTVAGKRNVGIVRVELVGNYAARIVFDDGHDTGLYPWPWLYRLGRDQERIWLDYLDALAERGLSRDR